jgi:hypothetical protein
MSPNVFKVGTKEYPVEDCYIYGVFEDEIDEAINWNLVVEFPGEEVHASFQGISFRDVHDFEGLQNKTFRIEDDEEDYFLYEGIEEELIYVDEIHFSKLDKENQTIEVNVIGLAADEIIEDEENEDEEIIGEELDIQLTADFEGIYFYTENKKNVEKFVVNHLKKKLDEVEIEYEKEEDFWSCLITY